MTERIFDATSDPTDDFDAPPPGGSTPPRAVERFCLGGLEAVIWEHCGPLVEGSDRPYTHAVTVARIAGERDGLPAHTMTLDELPAARRLWRWAEDLLIQLHQG